MHLIINRTRKCVGLFNDTTLCAAADDDERWKGIGDDVVFVVCVVCGFTHGRFSTFPLSGGKEVK